MGNIKNNNINKKDNTKLANTFIIIGIVFLIISLIYMFVKNNGSKVAIKEIKYQEYQEIINKDEYSVILLTSPTCSHCISYKPYVNYVANEYNIVVYDIDLSTLEYDEYNEIHDKYSAIASEYNEDEPVIPTPVTLIVRNGEEVASSLGNIGEKGFTSLLKNNNVIK